MKFTLATIAAIAATAAAVDVTNLPQCSISCLASAAGPTGCQLLDLDCQCKPANQESIRAAATPCIIQSCKTQQELLQAVQVTYEICQERGGAVGGLNTVTGIPQSDLSALSTAFPQALGGSAAATGMASASAMASSAAPMAYSSSKATSAATMKASSSQYYGVYPSATSKATSKASMTAASTPAAYTGAAAQAGVAVGALAAAAVALL